MTVEIKLCPCYGYSITNCKVYHSMNAFVCEERDTQQENSYTKHAFRKRLLVTATPGRVNEAYSEMYVVSAG